MLRKGVGVAWWRGEARRTVWTLVAASASLLLLFPFFGRGEGGRSRGVSVSEIWARPCVAASQCS
jgi:hypothetical protein